MSVRGSRPAQHRGITPNLIIHGVGDAIAFYQQALGAEVLYQASAPDGVTLHAQMRVGDAYVFLSDDCMCNDSTPTGSPAKYGGVSSVLDLYVDDVDAAFDRALKAGGTRLEGPVDMFYGDRIAIFRDPYGHLWSLGTAKEELSEEELYQRMLQHFGNPVG